MRIGQKLWIFYYWPTFKVCRFLFPRLYSNTKIIFKVISWYLALKLTLRTVNIYFLNGLNQVVLQDIKKSFEEAHLDARVYWISHNTLWNSTTVITQIVTDLDKKITVVNRFHYQIFLNCHFRKPFFCYQKIESCGFSWKNNRWLFLQTFVR